MSPALQVVSVDGIKVIGGFGAWVHRAYVAEHA